MRIPCYALTLSSLLLAGAGASFGQALPTAPAPAGLPAGANPLPSGQQTPSAPVAPPAGSAATPTPTESVPYGAGMKINISPDGSKYLRFSDLAPGVDALHGEQQQHPARAGQAPVRPV